MSPTRSVAQRRGPLCLAAVAVVFMLCGPASAQQPATADRPAATVDRPATDDAADKLDASIDRFLKAAKSGSPAVRPQAAARLLALGDKAVPRLLRECGDTSEDMARLGSQVIEILARFGDPRLRARLWTALDDTDFPWRPACARSLADSPRKEETDRFGAGLKDRLAAVRIASIEALSKLRALPWKPYIRELFDDPNDRVRRAAAASLDAFGHRRSLLWVAEDLRRSDRFFHLDTGGNARFQAIRLIEERLGRRFGYDATLPADHATNVAAVNAIHAEIARLTSPQLPPMSDIARAGKYVPGNVLGIELKSCRSGEVWLRWNEDDTLLVGTGNAVRIPLARGTTAKLLKIARDAAAATDNRHLWGKPGCDHEQYYVVDADGSVLTYRISKGPDPVADLRPDALDRVAAAMLASLPAAPAPGKSDATRKSDSTGKGKNAGKDDDKGKNTGKDDDKGKNTGKDDGKGKNAGKGDGKGKNAGKGENEDARPASKDPRLIDLSERVREALLGIGGPLEPGESGAKEPATGDAGAPDAGAGKR